MEILHETSWPLILLACYLSGMLPAAWFENASRRNRERTFGAGRNSPPTHGDLVLILLCGLCGPAVGVVMTGMAVGAELSGRRISDAFVDWCRRDIDFPSLRRR